MGRAEAPAFESDQQGVCEGVGECALLYVCVHAWVYTHVQHVYVCTRVHVCTRVCTCVRVHAYQGCVTGPIVSVIQCANRGQRGPGFHRTSQGPQGKKSRDG